MITEITTYIGGPPSLIANIRFKTKLFIRCIHKRGKTYIFAPSKQYCVNLVIDIGNTTAKLVAFKSSTLIEEVRTCNKTLKDLPLFVKKYSFEKGIISSVTEFTEEVRKQLHDLRIPLLYFNASTPTPLINDYKTPSTLGADRLAAAVGAYTLQPGHDILIIDAGTCLTFEFVDKGGHYKGGAISPGLQMRLKALNTFTAKLPLVEPDGDTPNIGYDTETSIRSGAVRGIVAEITGRIRSFEEKYPSLLVFLTGGDTFNFDNSIKKRIFADKNIVARGLNRILEYNELP